MAHESDMDLNLSQLSSAELAKFIKEASGLLEKKVKSETKQLEKVETKRAAAAPPKGKTPVQFLKNNAWVEFVLNHMLTEGWESFTHAERFGKSVADVLYPESELVPFMDEKGEETVDEDGDVVHIHVFKDSVTKGKPNGEQPTLSHAMTVSKLYWSPATLKKSGTGSKPELYEAFESEYVPPQPEEGASASSTEKKVVVRRTMTKEEREREKEEKAAEKAAEKERKQAEREAEKERKRQEKEEEKERKRQEKEAEKASKASGKIPKGAIRGVVTSKGSPVATAAVKVKAPLSVKAASATSSVTPCLKVKPVVKPKPAVKEDWVPPAKGKSKDFTLNGVTYLRDHLDRMWTKDTKGQADECVGVYIVATNSISDEDVPEDEDE
jgi:hypothetical protein